MTLRRQFALHRWLGLAAALALLLFGSSGLLHIALSRLQPQPATFAPPAVALPATALTLQAALQANGIDSVTAARSVAFERHTFYRVRTPLKTRHYLEVTTGKRMPFGEEQHAVALARHFSGESQVPIASTRYVTAFDAEYPAVNRLLPVWRVELARPDRLTLFVDTEGDRLATLTDDRKRWLQSLFRQLHNFEWATRAPWLRLPLMVLLLAATGATAIIGLLLWRRRPYAPPSATRRWHRRVGLAVVVTTFAFVISGLWRLLLGDGQNPPAPPAAQFAATALTAPAPASGFVLIDTPAGPCYLATAATGGAHREHQHHHRAAPRDQATASDCGDSRDGAELADAERQRAVQLAQHYAGSRADASEATLLRRFDHEYGFINKRLPVWRVVLAGDSTRWYVETSSGALARRVDTAVAVESAVFSWLHKWQFFGDAKGARDTLQVVFVSGNIGAGLLGLLLWARRPTRRRR